MEVLFIGFLSSLCIFLFFFFFLFFFCSLLQFFQPIPIARSIILYIPCPIVRGILSLSGCVALTLFLHSPSGRLGPLLMAELLCILVSCGSLIPLLPRPLPSLSAVHRPPRRYLFPTASSLLTPCVMPFTFPCFIGSFLSCSFLSPYSSAPSFLVFCWCFGSSLRSFPLLRCSDSFSCGVSLRNASFMSHLRVPQPSLPFCVLVFPSLPSPFSAISPFVVLCGVLAISFWLSLLIPFTLLFFWVLRGFSFLLSAVHLCCSLGCPAVCPLVLVDYPPSSPSPLAITYIAFLIWHLVAAYSILLLFSRCLLAAVLSPLPCGYSLSFAPLLSLGAPSLFLLLSRFSFPLSLLSTAFRFCYRCCSCRSTLSRRFPAFSLGLE